MGLGNALQGVSSAAGFPSVGSGERAFQAADNDAKCSSVSMCCFLNSIILNAAVELLSPSSRQPVLGCWYVTVSGV